MKRINLPLIFFMVLVLLMLSAGSVFSQDIDVSSMDNEQLMQLLQQIMEKLEDQETESRIQDPETGIQKSGSGILEAGQRIFSIYENKKLILERMPDYYFTQAQQNDDENDNTSRPSDPGKKKEEGQYIDEKEICMDWCREFITQTNNYDLVSCWYDYCGF